mmetsp:Transcript_95225/g.239923  ORF Transcript_95225/g.239923 Transcript_95225/m.239923 type:complete len:207 (-) Transcript_95225:808-1428(-)
MNKLRFLPASFAALRTYREKKTPTRPPLNASTPKEGWLGRWWPREAALVALGVQLLGAIPSRPLLALNVDPTHHAILLMLQEVAMCYHFAREPVDVDTNCGEIHARRQHRVVPIPGLVVGIVPDIHNLVRVHVQVKGVISDTSDLPLLHLPHLDLQERRWHFMTPKGAYSIGFEDHWVHLRHLELVVVLSGDLCVSQVGEVARPTH